MCSFSEVQKNLSDYMGWGNEKNWGGCSYRGIASNPAGKACHNVGRVEVKREGQKME